MNTPVPGWHAAAYVSPDGPVEVADNGRFSTCQCVTTMLNETMFAMIAPDRCGMSGAGSADANLPR